MALHLVTGYKGTAHITSADQGAFNAALIGTEDYVCKTGRQFEAQIMTNNSVRIYDGDLLMQGRHVNLKVDTYEDVTIENGAQGMNRNDLIVCRYAKDATSGQEAALFVVLKGTPTEGTASDPAVTSGDILGGAILHEMPLYRVKIEGLSIVAIQKLYSVVSPVVDVVTQEDMEAYALPKTGGTLKADGLGNQLRIHRNGTSGSVCVQYENDGGLLGHIGVTNTGEPVFVDAKTGNAHILYNPLNKPTASDVGAVKNGSKSIGEIGFDADNELYILLDGAKYRLPFGYGRGNAPFLPLTGGTLSGALKIGNSLEIVGTDTVLQMTLNKAYGNNVYTYLAMSNSGALDDILQVCRNVSGTRTNYKLFGEHNITCGTTAPTSLATGCIYEMYE